MAQVAITASEIAEFRVIYADMCGEDVDETMSEEEIAATDLSLDDFLARRALEYRCIIEGRDTASFLGHRGMRVVVAQFEGKTLAAGPGIRR